MILYYNSKKSKAFKSLSNFAISTTYLRHPEEDPVSRAKQSLMAFSEAERSRLMKIVFHHVSEKKGIQNAAEVPIDEFVKPLYDFQEFIPCPRCFDYSHYEHRSSVHYGEPCITAELETIDDASSDINWDDLLDQNEKIVFVTAGSQVLDYEERALRLFMAMMSAMQSADMNGYHLILCVGSTLIQNEWDDYDNVTVCGWAPQRKILSALAEKKHKGSCAVIHGGLATIKECIYFNVPFLVLPLGKDQMDNALRLEDCGIKNRFFIEYIKPKCLLYFINQALQDYVSLNNLEKLSKIFQTEETMHTAAKAIADLAKTDL